MPFFSTQRVIHPYFATPSFKIDVKINTAGISYYVPAFIDAAYRNCVVSGALAVRLGLIIEGREASGEISVRTTFEDGCLSHESRRFFVRFRIAEGGVLGPTEAYIHFALDELRHVFEPELIQPAYEDDFLVLRPQMDVRKFCLVD